MVEHIRFGLLRIGEHWSVVTDHGDRLSFLTREAALKAARDLMAVERGFGHKVELLSQNEAFELQTEASKPQAGTSEPRA